MTNESLNLSQLSIYVQLDDYDNLKIPFEDGNTSPKFSSVIQFSSDTADLDKTISSIYSENVEKIGNNDKKYNNQRKILEYKVGDDNMDENYYDQFMFNFSSQFSSIKII